jgi:hypothetical protein
MPPGATVQDHLTSALGERWKLSLAAALATATLFAEGVLKSGWIAAALLAPTAWYLLAPRITPLFPNLLVSLLSASLTISVVDLCLRPLIGHHLHYTPTNMFTRKLPTLPIVGRWDANVSHIAQSYGDLAAIAQEPSFREPRQIVFQTDEAGFRNQRVARPIDLLVLGDSFSAGVGTSQEHVFSSLLNVGGRHVYNLSYPGGPYDEYVNFAVEGPRLPLASDAWLIWTLYTGNDLDDGYGTTWDPAQFRTRTGLSAWAVRFRTFRNRSPLNQLMQGVRARMSHDPEVVLVRRLPDGRPMLFVRNHEWWGQQSRAEVERHPNFPKLERTLAAMRDLAAARHVRLAVLMFPTKGEVYRWVLEERLPQQSDEEPSGFAQAVSAACLQVQITCVDSKPYLVKVARQLFQIRGDLLWWRDDTHLGWRGHEAIAAFIAGAILYDKSPGFSIPLSAQRTP